MSRSIIELNSIVSPGKADCVPICVEEGDGELIYLIDPSDRERMFDVLGQLEEGDVSSSPLVLTTVSVFGGLCESDNLVDRVGLNDAVFLTDSPLFPSVQKTDCSSSAKVMPAGSTQELDSSCLLNVKEAEEATEVDSSGFVIATQKEEGGVLSGVIVDHPNDLPDPTELIDLAQVTEVDREGIEILTEGVLTYFNAPICDSAFGFPVDDEPEVGCTEVDGIEELDLSDVIEIVDPQAEEDPNETSKPLTAADSLVGVSIPRLSGSGSAWSMPKLVCRPSDALGGLGDLIQATSGAVGAPVRTIIPERLLNS